MRDIVSGLAHLHQLGIVHRDLKPQNVLIQNVFTLSAKLSDMGISKRLSGDMSSFGHLATGCGSSGWQAPEQLLQGRQTRRVDMFSLGCVLFYTITGCDHPFGDDLERDVNIVNNNVDLSLVEHLPEVSDLISRLLNPNPDLRPSASEVLLHPMFWNSETRLSFLRDASDRVELENRETDSEILKAMESTAPVAIGGKWDEKLESDFITNIGRYRRYKYDSIRDLLRVIRNKLNHYRELPPEIQELVGTVPEGFDEYFAVRFPKLLIEVYRVISLHCKEEEVFRKYFKSNII
jgi:serine/threonine-protein kinase/endoribonuclease IRE1